MGLLSECRVTTAPEGKKGSRGVEEMPALKAPEYFCAGTHTYCCRKQLVHVTQNKPLFPQCPLPAAPP